MTRLTYPVQMRLTDRLSHIIWLTNRKATGNPEALARRIGVSKTRFWELIKMIKESGIEIEYDRTIGSYWFAQEKKYDLQFEIVEAQIENIG